MAIKKNPTSFLSLAFLVLAPGVYYIYREKLYNY